MAYSITSYGTPVFFGQHATVTGLILTNVSYNTSTSKAEQQGPMGRFVNVTYYDETGTWSADGAIVADTATAATTSPATVPSGLTKGSRLTALETALPENLFTSAVVIAPVEDVNITTAAGDYAQLSLSGTLYADLPGITA